jgi:hypothetical protein
VLRHRGETRELAALGAPVVMECEPKPNAASRIGEVACRRVVPVVAQPDPVPTKRDRTIAMKLVNQADRELAIAIDACRDPDHEALVAALLSARTVIGVHMREMVSKPRDTEDTQDRRSTRRDALRRRLGHWASVRRNGSQAGACLPDVRTE